VNVLQNFSSEGEALVGSLMFEKTAVFVSSSGNGFFHENQPPFNKVFKMGGFKDNRELSTDKNENIFIIYNHNGYSTTFLGCVGSRGLRSSRLIS
jgi:hypothetical protein